MTLLLKIMGIAIICITAALFIKPYRPEYAFLISVMGAAIALVTALSYIESYFSLLTGILADTNLPIEYFSVALKAVGIGYLTEFAADTAKDSGQTSVSSIIIFGGRTAILVLALPIIKSLLELALSLVKK